MKIAVIKLGSRISFNARDTSGGNGEARSIISMLEQGGAQVHIFTKILEKDQLLPEYTWHDLVSADLDAASQRYDALVVLNGQVNFFGGVEDTAQLRNYVLINKFRGPVFYVLCDPELTLKQVWKSVQGKPWGSNWTQEQLFVSRSDIIYLSQPYDTAAVLGALGANEPRPRAVVHWPFEKFPCMRTPLDMNPTPTADLSYGGTMRGGRRQRKMAKFYFGHPHTIDVEMFGKITAEDFSEKFTAGLRPPRFTGPVNYEQMLPKMNSALAHCVIGDPWYEKINDIPQRTYESINSNVVTFIDADMDTIKRVYARDRELADFLYVSDRAELSEKILLLKEEPVLRRQILADQRRAVAWDAQTYCRDFVGLIKDLADRS